MTGITQEKAWGIFRADKLGQPEGKSALANMTGPEQQAYGAFAEEFEMKLAQIGVEAQNEAATIAEDNPTIVQEVETLHAYDWTADHYIKVVSLFKGSKFEKLHLSAAFRVPNAELLLGLVKP
jgi:hypothetical protein